MEVCTIFINQQENNKCLHIASIHHMLSFYEQLRAKRWVYRCKTAKFSWCEHEEGVNTARNASQKHYSGTNKQFTKEYDIAESART
jgi:hypothetical protein